MGESDSPAPSPCSYTVVAANIRSRITTRWNGPGMLRQKQEEIEVPVPGRASEGAIPGRSARGRYAEPGALHQVP